jgi:hypothetical protein
MWRWIRKAYCKHNLVCGMEETRTEQGRMLSSQHAYLIIFLIECMECVTVCISISESPCLACKVYALYAWSVVWGKGEFLVLIILVWHVVFMGIKFIYVGLVQLEWRKPGGSSSSMLNCAFLPHTLHNTHATSHELLEFLSLWELVLYREMQIKKLISFKRRQWS